MPVMPLMVIPKVIKAWKTLPKYPFDPSKVVFYVNFWDGPIEGLYRLDGREYWFRLFTEEYVGRGKKRVRVFFLIGLLKDQIAEEKLWHQLFKLLVNDGKRVRPRKMWDRFYKPHGARLPVQIRQESIVGKLIEK